MKKHLELSIESDFCTKFEIKNQSLNKYTWASICKVF